MIGFGHLTRLKIALLVLVGISVSGILGFMLIEGYTFNEALYMTIITISTVGFQEIRPLSVIGRYFTSVLIVFSFGTFAYTISAIYTYLINGELRRYYLEVRKQKRILQMKNHVIICGYGRNGQQVALDLKRLGQEYLIIERDENSFKELGFYPKHFIVGDATVDQVLMDAGIERAKALITTLPEDADNVFVVLTAREINPDLKIISRASVDSSDQKLRRAGADNVVMPDKVGGTHMATLIMQPDVIEFFDLVSNQNNDIKLEEIPYESLPEEFKGHSIQDLEIRKRSGANIIGLKTSSGSYIINPSPSEKITEGSKLFVLGMIDQIETLKQWK
jgi:voltage-gated potassium channel